MTAEMKTTIEQEVITLLADELSINHNIYVDRDRSGAINWIACPATQLARDIADDTPALYEERGNSLMLWVKYPEAP